jgi:2-oxoglutarate ferredoxin oxidoreductase subunit alpha
MTPSSAVMNYLSAKAEEFDIVVMLTEDEISAAGVAIGAAHAGVRSMTGTSGGGFCLMTEFLGLSAMAEIPMVILEGQRPGPATGLPTRTEQGDLKFVLSAHQGDFPRVVMAAGDPEEAFYLTFDCFNIAEKYQLPVIILSDKHVGESSWTMLPFDTSKMTIDRGEVFRPATAEEAEGYLRFRFTESGISPRALPGTPGTVFRATGNEHLESGYISEDPDIRRKMVDKRARKLDSFNVEDIGVKLHGDQKADITLVGWGSTKPVILDVIENLSEEHGIKANFLQVIYMEPFPANRVSKIIGKAKHSILIENNATGQLGALIREKTGILLEDRILKYNGRQFNRDELLNLVLEKLGTGTKGQEK